MYQGYNQILVEKQDKLLLIKFNNPKKKNCLNVIAYGEIARAFREVAQDDSVTIVVITGVGEFFTAGNDLSQTSDFTDMEAYMKESGEIFKGMVSAVIDCPKIVITLVNGPCIGIGVTLAGLSDLVWCSDTTYFHTPFVSLGIVPEACSSYLFPLLMGRSKASELLLFSEKMTAEDAFHYHFVSRVFKLHELSSIILPKIREYSELPPESMQASKKLLRMHERGVLYKALDAESDALTHRLQSEEFFNALISFSMRKKSKL